MAIKGLTATLLLTATVHPAAAQSLISTVDNPFKVAASYHGGMNHPTFGNGTPHATKMLKAGELRTAFDAFEPLRERNAEILAKRIA